MSVAERTPSADGAEFTGGTADLAGFATAQEDVRCEGIEVKSRKIFKPGSDSIDELLAERVAEERERKKFL